MRLGQLINLMREYDNTLYLRKFYYGDHERAKKIKKFLRSFKQGDDYTLNASEEFRLALLLSSVEDDLPLIKQFKSLFTNSSIFFQLFSRLMKKKLVDENNFVEIHASDSEKIGELHRLFCARIFKPSNITKDLLKTVLFVVKKSTPNVTEECFRLLSSKNLINDDSLKLIEKNAEYLFLLLEILRELDKSKQLNTETLKRLLQYESLFHLAKLLPLLNGAEININDELLTLISQNQSLYDVTDTCAIIIKADKTLLDAVCFKSILNIAFGSVSYIAKTLNLLDSKQLINKDTLTAVLSRDHFSLSQALNVFAETNLLDATLFNKLTESKLSLFTLYQSAAYLHDNNLLNSETLELVFSDKISATFKKAVSILVAHVHVDNQVLKQIASYPTTELQNLTTLIEKFNEKKLFDGQRVQQLLNLSSDYYVKLFDLVISLEKHKQLNNETLDALFLKLSNKLDKPDEGHFVVEQQSGANLAWTHYRSTTAQFQLYVKQDPNKTPLAGGRAKILQGNKSLTEDSTQYLVKTLNEGSLDEDTEKEACKETKYARFLGRESYFFQNNKRWQIISEWQSGQALDIVLETGILSTHTLKNRLGSLIPLLKDLSKLHAQFRVHGDIKCQNCVLDQHSMQLKLIDFGSTRKVKPKSYQIPWTPHYLDKYLHSFFQPTNHYSFCDDMYTLGIVIASMFPEIYLVRLDKSNTEVNLCKPRSSLSSEEMTVFYLVSSMLDMNRNARSTSQAALTYIQAVVSDFENISESHLEKILMTTLWKQDCTFDDILHDHSTPLLN